MERVVKELWADVKIMSRECLHEEVAEWVLNLGNTAGHTSAYDRMLITYWLTMRLMGHSSVVHEVKGEGDVETVHF